MKNILFLVSFGISFLTFSIEDEKGEGLKYVPQVHVMKDSVDLTIPTGKMKINAEVYYQIQLTSYEFEYKKCTAEQVAYYLLDGKNPIKILNGSFSFQGDTSLQYIQFDKCSDCKVSLFETVYLENYKFQSQHVLTLEVYIPLKASQTMMMVDKPVIYAYSDKEQNFTLNLKVKGELTFTYPQLPADNSWKMKTALNGNLEDEKGIQFPYLFWEAKQNEASLRAAKANSNELVSGKDIVAYFEKELTKLGFNSREKSDFITFWCPKFVDSKMVHIQFFVDDNCSVIGDLNISPKPDNLRRIYVTFEKNPKVVTDFVAKELKVEKLERTGFTVIEWGGSEFNSYEY